MQSDEHTTMVDEFDITDITDSEFTARLKVTAIVDGTEESVSENAIRLTKVTADYSEAILGLWECRGITGGETNNDDNARLEFRKTETHNRQLVVVKQDIRTSHIPVIMLTAKDTQVDQQEGYEVEADSYLTKPFSISMLRSRIVNLLTARKRLAAYLSATDKQKTESEADTLSQLDRQFLNDITAYIEQHISDQNITMALIGDSVHMSHSTLYRKIKALTGLSGNEFIRKIRLRHCIHLMIHEHRNISEAAYESGFNNIPYFRNCFKEEYGMTPTEYLRLSH